MQVLDKNIDNLILIEISYQKNLKNCKSRTINLTEVENYTLIYVYASKQKNTRCGLNYTIIGSLSDELNEQTTLFQFWSNSYINSQIKFDNFNEIEFGNLSAYGLTFGYPLLPLIRKHNFTSRSSHLSSSLQIYSINFDNQQNGIYESQTLNKLEILLAKINTKTCNGKIDKLANTDDIIHIIGYRSLSKNPFLKVRINDN